MIITFGGTKGGVAKSTLTVNTASYLKIVRHHRVAVIDSDDPNYSSHLWAENRQALHEDERPVIPVDKKTGRGVATSIDERRTDYDDVVIDCGGHEGSALTAAMMKSHIAVIPFRPSLPDMDTLYEVDRIIEQARIANPNLLAYALITVAPSNPKRPDLEEAWNFMVEAIDRGDFQEMDGVMEACTRDRTAWHKTFQYGLSLPEMPFRPPGATKNTKPVSDPKAYQELETLVTELDEVTGGKE